MLGLLVIIVVSWLLLHFLEKKSIDALGIIPNKKRSVQFLIGFIIMAFINLLTIYFESIALNIEWELKKSIDYKNIFKSFVYHLKSALTEDLVFRGAILYILIQRIGAKKGILISAIAFGVYHIFSYGLIGGNIILILYITLITGITGYVWAYTFHKTKSIMMGLGFHLGYNLLMTFFYESAPYGELVFKEISKTNLTDWDWVYYNLAKGLFPSAITLIVVNQFTKHQLKKNKL